MTNSSSRPKRKGLVINMRVGESIPLDMAPNDSISVDPSVDIRKLRITLEHKQGQIARLRLEASPSVKVGKPETVE